MGPNRAPLPTHGHDKETVSFNLETEVVSPLWDLTDVSGK